MFDSFKLPKVEESAFRRYFYQKSAGTNRMALVLGTLLYIVFGLLDPWAAPKASGSIWIIRYAIFTPLAVTILVLSFTRLFRKYNQILLSIYVILAGFGILGMIYLIDKSEMGYNTYYAGLLLVIIFNFSMLRIRFRHAMLLALTLLMGYELLLLFDQHTLNSPEGLVIFINNNFFFVTAIILGAFSCFFLELYMRKDFINQRIITLEKEKHENLLLNILPRSVAEELRTFGKAEVETFRKATVLFTDFEGFTRFGERWPPEKLIEELNDCFYNFDEIIARHELEKIKTIGDGYMCAGGLPKANKSNPVDAVLAGLEIQRFMERRYMERRLRGEDYWVCRLGINTGEVIAGVIGKNKFSYDIWGDTVNLASRMESCGEPGMVNISENTYLEVKDFFDFRFRGPVEAKGKGMVNMYFVHHIKVECSKGGLGIEPNERFDELRLEKFGGGQVRATRPGEPGRISGPSSA